MGNWYKNEGDYKKIYIGFTRVGEDFTAVTGQETREQIDEMRKCKIAIPDVTWENLYDEKEDRTLLRCIEVDRERRAFNVMADRPPCLVLWIREKGDEDVVERLEFYQGHDYLKKLHDVRAASYSGPDTDSVGG